MISEEACEKAVDYLLTSAKALGEATARAVSAEHLRKHIWALEMKKHNGPVSAQEREAYASEAYKAAVDEEAIAAAELIVIKAKRDAAKMRIETWRSQQANARDIRL